MNMSGELVVKKDQELTVAGLAGVPAVVMAAGKKAGLRFIEFFTANIRNPNTRRAYHRACCDFFRWCESRKLDLERIGPVHVAAYIEMLGKDLSRPSVKQALAAVRMLFDWLVVGQVVPFNPAASVRGPRYTTKKGKTPVLSADEARVLLDSIKVSGTVTDDDGSEREGPRIVGLRDRALIALMTYTFARVGAAIGMDVEDYYVQGRRRWVRLHEKGGKRHEMPAHHNLAEYLAAYIEAAGIGNDKGTPLFRTARGKTGDLTERRMSQPEVYLMVRRRAADAGIQTKIGNHTFRATGITAYLKNGGKLEVAQQMAAHESARTTGLYDRRGDEISLDEVERIAI
jgi:site-specific recombinase XerD